MTQGNHGQAASSPDFERPSSPDASFALVRERLSLSFATTSSISPPVLGPLYTIAPTIQ